MFDIFLFWEMALPSTFSFSLLFVSHFNFSNKSAKGSFKVWRGLPEKVQKSSQTCCEQGNATLAGKT
jgi:hypothetical protein